MQVGGCALCTVWVQHAGGEREVGMAMVESRRDLCNRAFTCTVLTLPVVAQWTNMTYVCVSVCMCICVSTVHVHSSHVDVRLGATLHAAATLRQH